jgi:hypothetical protein
MVSKSALEYVKELQDRGETIFYNGEGDPFFFRNNIKHLSYSLSMNFCVKNGKKDGIDILRVVVPILYLIQDNDAVFSKLQFGDNIELIPLKELE